MTSKRHLSSFTERGIFYPVVDYDTHASSRLFFELNLDNVKNIGRVGQLR